ncbi:O-acyltransferase like protein-like [Dermacentor silvarum]|uniref:O-acyltransferase like protein-like n=1 Tax=Dermacentor silvarum TaxID=543639 RepID=UPI00210079C1|nr:O-acyltransferase like protein-like [Dermacentor silvarum]
MCGRFWFVLVASFCFGVLVSTSTHNGDAALAGDSGGSATASSVSPASPKENIAATIRRFVSSLAHKMPPWVKQKLIEVPVSMQCSLALFKMLRGLSDLEPWAMRMFDSTGKMPTGVFTGTVSELGSFDECLATVVRDDSGRELVRAQYCSLYIRMDNDTSLGEILLPGLLMTHRKAPVLMAYQKNPIVPGFRWGICVISECQEEELQAVARSLIGDAVTVNVKDCVTDITPPLTTSQIVIVTILATILSLMVAASFVDAYATDDVKKNVAVNVLMCFSMPANLRLLASTPEKTSNAYNLRFMHGVRAFSIYYIVYGHSASELAFTTSGSLNILGYMDRYDSTLTAASFMSVDNFFFLSGYLLFYTLSGVKNGRGIVAVIIIAVRRWYRLVLPLVFVACCFSLLPLFATGPTTSLVYDKFYEDVSNYWWALLFNIRNMYEELTLGINAYTWYISADYQLFLAALLVYQLAGTRAIIGALAVLSIACSSFTAWQMHGSRYSPVIVQLTETYDDYLNMLTNVYMLPTYHAACFFGGCITFYVVEKFKNEKISKAVQVMLWAMVIGLSAACVLYRFEWTRGTRHSELAKVSLAFWDRILWALSLAVFTFLLATRRGGFLQKTLSAAPLAVLSRLSYGIYLVHFPFYFLWKSAVREKLYFSTFNLFSQSVSVFVWSGMLALVMFLACEAPVGRLDKIMWGKSPQKKKEEQINGGHDLELPTHHSEAPQEMHQQ